MGCGKSSVGVELAEKMDRFLIDSDSLIERRARMSVESIFLKFGESGFRDMEKKFIEWAKDSIKNSIISSGGGLPMHCDMRDVGDIFYIECSFETIKKRVERLASSERPLFKDIERARELYESRIQKYREVSHCIVDGEDSIESVAKNILEMLSKR